MPPVTRIGTTPRGLGSSISILLAPPFSSKEAIRTARRSARHCAPDWIQTIARFNPLYHAVAAIRALFNANYADGEITTGLVLLVILAIVTVTFGARSFSRAAA
jgi:hypothetical protein